MAMALQLARKGVYSTHPNPRVGCVIVQNENIVGAGWHSLAGQPHAEIYALNEAKDKARGATAYVTLEPCSHQGRTGPCADALINAGIKQVVVAMTDPNPQVSGKGLARLKQAGIVVVCGVLAEESRQLNEGFCKRMEQGLPFVRLKMAMSLDGRTAMSSGESQWITQAPARSIVQKLRAQSSAIVVGADTVLVDRARLTVRPDELDQRTVLRVLIDGQLRVPIDVPFFQAGPALVATCRDCPREDFAQQGHRQLTIPGPENHVDLRKLLHYLAKQEANEVLVETGSKLAGAFLQQKLVDELKIFMAPKLLGSYALPLFDLPFSAMREALALDIKDIRAVGNDWLITAKPKY
ncbi:UNVERIFIED_CONTAM: hypothetical protein GTU68_041416 [Idotea baltica]|nr:hypothetical protein [Idotea baltica]